MIRNSDKVQLPAETIDKGVVPFRAPSAMNQEKDKVHGKLRTSKVAKRLDMRTAELTDKLVTAGLLIKDGDHAKLTNKRKAIEGAVHFPTTFVHIFCVQL